jgi:hypothetical protein
MGDTVRSRWTITWHAAAAWRLIAPLWVAALYPNLPSALPRPAGRKIARVPEAT